MGSYPRRLIQNSSRGFTLIEGLFSLIIVLMVMGALTQTLRQAAEVKKNTKNMDQSIEEFHALFTMKADALAATAVNSPTPGSSSNDLALRKVNPRLSFLQRIDVLSDPTDPFENSEKVTVEYRLDEGILKRFVTLPGNITSAERLLKAKSFQASLTGSDPGLLTLSLEIEGTRVTKTRSIKVAMKSL